MSRVIELAEGDWVIADDTLPAAQDVGQIAGVGHDQVRVRWVRAGASYNESPFKVIKIPKATGEALSNMYLNERAEEKQRQKFPAQVYLRAHYGKLYRVKNPQPGDGLYALEDYYG